MEVDLQMDGIVRSGFDLEIIKGDVRTRRSEDVE